MNRQDVAKKIIISDIKEILDAYSSCAEDTCAHFMLGGLLYFAMIISGAVDWCNKAGEAVDCNANKEIVDKLRAKIKLYSNDTVIPLSEQKSIMSDIIKVEKQYWIDKQAESGKWCPKFIIPDIGAYRINNHYIGNTLEYAYEYSPLNPDKLPILTALGAERSESSLIYNFSVEIGQTMKNLYYKIGNSRYLLNGDKNTSITVVDNDFRMANRCFFKKENAIYAFNLCCRINYLLELLLPLCREESFFAFRMIYVTFYHIKDDFENLGLNFVHYSMPYRDKNFRNAMAHYSLYGKIDEKEIDDSVIGYGLIEKFFDETFENVNHELIEEFRKTRDSLERYVRI